jgi:hypothetical protein
MKGKTEHYPEQNINGLNPEKKSKLLKYIYHSISLLSEFLTSQLWLGNIHLSWDVSSIGLGSVVLCVI